MTTTIHSKPQYTGKVYGIELEIEAEGLYSVEETYDEETEKYQNIDPNIPLGWLREQEDSIIGVELISNGAYDFKTSLLNIERVFNDIERQGYRPVRTPRGSTHVHANVADLSWQQMKHFVTACAWAEPTLIELAGKGRKGNQFAQSYETTPVGWHPIIEWCRKGEIHQNTDTHYMATSFHPMGYLGSVEFRMGPSSRNVEEAISWLRCIDTVVEAGRTLPVTGLEVPLFLSSLLSKLDERKQGQLRKKGARCASEVWYGLIEHYEKPPQARRGLKKSYADLMDEQILQYATQYAAIPSVPIPEGTFTIPSLQWADYPFADIVPPPVVNPDHCGDP